MMSQFQALVVEDDVDLSEIFSEALQSAGYEVEVVNDGNLAMQRLGEITPYVVILDLHLPGVDGRHILQSIRTDERLKETLVVIASADAGLAQTLDADLTLLKPISFTQLRDLTRRLMKKSSINK